MTNIEPSKHIVALNKCTDPKATPLFIFHEITGDTFYYRPLAKRLQHKFPVYGVQLFDTGFEHCGISLPELCSIYVKAIRAVCPFGPYRLAGWSSGGMLTIEAAYQLLSVGAEVEFVGLLDCSRDTERVESDSEGEDPEMDPLTDPEFRIQLAEDYFGVEVDLLPLLNFSEDPQAAPLFSPESIEKILASEELDPIFAEIQSVLGWSKTKIIDKLNTALTTKLMDDKYYCPSLPVDVHLFYTNQDEGFTGQEETLVDSLEPGRVVSDEDREVNSETQELLMEWVSLFGDRLKSCLVPGDHKSMLESPHVNILAEAILTSLLET